MPLNLFKAKLLRRSSSSSSSAKNVPVDPTAPPPPPPPSTSPSLDSTRLVAGNSPYQNASNGFKQSLDRRRHSQPQPALLTPPAPSSIATAVNTRPASCLLRPKSPLANSVLNQHDIAPQETEPQTIQTLERESESPSPTQGKPNLLVPPPQGSPPAATPPPPSTSTTTQIWTAPEPGAKSKTPVESNVAEALRTQLDNRSLEEYSFPAVSRENSAYIPRLSRHSTRSVAATSTRSLNVVDETTPNRSTPLLSQPPVRALPSPNRPVRPTIAVRRQSLVPSSQQRLIKTLLDPVPAAPSGDYFSRGTPYIQPDMISRKIWVKRAGCSPTLVSVTEEDLVDDLREAILRKYGNSLGRHLDAPDIVMKLALREPSSKQSNQERLLGPEEPVGRTLDLHYPGGQSVEEALIIDVPQRRTPKQSPRHQYIYKHPEDIHPGDPGEYFPPMAVIQTPNASGSVASSNNPGTHLPPSHSMSVITTGQLPPVPSPGSRGSWHHQQHRPKYPRQHTSSPNAAVTVTPGSMNDLTGAPSNGTVPSLPSPSTQNNSVPSPEQPTKTAATPPARVASPRLKQLKKSKKNSSGTTAQSSLPSSLLDGTVPPINVLIVEDNTINLKLLEAFMKRLKVRWQTAMNGREAVNKWRQGGFHLVLMDIQLPVMSGLEATREIRRLERVNNIGVFSKTVSGRRTPTNAADRSKYEEDDDETVKSEDILEKRGQFKSPVIIVALTASSLQSDRHEALAAGCNDFLTKPVNIVWLEQKVTEWGCMQALIDFEGWRKWRGFADISVKSPTAQAKALPDSEIPGSPAFGAAQSRQSSLTPKASEINGASLHTSAGKDSSTRSTSTIVPNGCAGAGIANGAAASKKGGRSTASGSARTTPG